MNVKNDSWKTYAFWIGLTEAVGALSGWLTREGARHYAVSVTKPPLSPPPAVFPVVWAMLYALMGIGAARVYMDRGSPYRARGLGLFAAQLAFNFCWSLLFFNAEAYGAAFLWLAVLLALILMMITTFNRVDRLAARLQIPYPIWVAFAGYLNLGVWLLNR